MNLNYENTNTIVYKTDSWWRIKIINKWSCVYLYSTFSLEHDHLSNRSRRVNDKVSWPVGAGLQDRPAYHCSLSWASSSPSTDLSPCLFVESEKQTKHSASVELKKTSQHPPVIQFYTTLFIFYIYLFIEKRIIQADTPEPGTLLHEKVVVNWVSVNICQLCTHKLR